MSEPTGAGIETVRSFMDRVNHGDMTGALQYVRSDVHVEEPPGLPYSGTYNGHAGLTELMDKIGSTWARWRETPNRLAEGDGVVFRQCSISAIFRSTGAKVEMPFIEMFEVDDEAMITAIRPHYWNPGIVHASTPAGGLSNGF